ncbi:MAG TPA: ribonuclease J [Blastocatellia bacterium]|nr:ribonuclease J [Blastocatellia bacterium]
MSGKLEIIPLGGLGEFGMNITALRYGDEMILIDAGMAFPDESLLGVDIIVPDMTFLEDNRHQLLAIVLTHVHEDHIGALPYILKTVNVPVYGTRFTMAMVEHKLNEHQILGDSLTHITEAGETIHLGPFDIEFIRVSHSTTDCVCLAIETPVGIIIHTADFKVDMTPVNGDPIDLDRLREYGDRGVLALLSDSTNSERPGRTQSERDVIPAFEDIFDSAPGRIIVSCFSSSIHRIQIVLDLARDYGRKVAILGRSLIRNLEIADSLRQLNVEPEMLITTTDVKRMPDERVTILATGCQGEPMAVLSRLAVDSYKGIGIEPSDTVVMSARFIPGNERVISRMMGHIFKKGARIVDNSVARVHVSGHASQEDLRIMFEAVRPKFVIPIHGEYRQLYRHKDYIHSLGFPLDDIIMAESGDVIAVDETSASVVARVFVGRTFIDESGFGKVEDAIIRDRKHLAYDGFVLPIVAINPSTGNLVSEPEIITRGFITTENGDNILTRARDLVAQTIEKSDHEERIDFSVIKEKIRIELKRFIQKETQRRPMIIPVVVEI